MLRGFPIIARLLSCCSKKPSLLTFCSASWNRNQFADLHVKSPAYSPLEGMLCVSSFATTCCYRWFVAHSPCSGSSPCGLTLGGQTCLLLLFIVPAFAFPLLAFTFGVSPSLVLHATYSRALCWVSKLSPFLGPLGSFIEFRRLLGFIECHLTHRCLGLDGA